MLKFCYLLQEHLDEIFSTFGKIKDIDFGNDKGKPWINKGKNFTIYFHKHIDDFIHN